MNVAIRVIVEPWEYVTDPERLREGWIMVNAAVAVQGISTDRVCGDGRRRGCIVWGIKAADCRTNGRQALRCTGRSGGRTDPRPE